MTTETPAPTPAPQPQASELQPNAAAPAAAPADGGAPANGEGQEPAETPSQTPEQIAEAERKRHEKNQRFGDLTKERNKAREEAAYWRGVAEAARNGTRPPEPPAPQAPTAPAGPPDPKDTAKYPAGEFDARYAADLAKFELRQEQEAERIRESARSAQEAARAEFEAGVARWQGVVEEAREAGEGFENAEAVLNSTTIPARSMDLITSADNPVHVAEYFGRNPKELRDVLAMPPMRQATLIAKLDHAISVNLAKAKPAATPAQPAPAAPQPSPAAMPTPVNGAGAAASFDPNKASFEEYKAARESGRFV